MTKGKYAARAANREAARDNELINEKLAEIGQLRTQIADLQSQLNTEKTARNTIIQTRAAELSTHQIAAIKTQLDDEHAKHKADKLAIAKILDLYVRYDDGYPPNWYWGEVLPLLIPDLADRNAFMNEQEERVHSHPLSREGRRQGTSRIARHYRERAGSDDLVRRLQGIAYDAAEPGTRKLSDPLTFVPTEE